MATTKRAKSSPKKSTKASTKSTKASTKASAVEIPAVFQRTPKLSLLHQAVTRHLANRRAGTAATKTRDEVAGGGRKPWRQKGTGRARHGSIRSPIWRKGGVVFGPHPRSFAVGMNKAARRRALAMAVSAKVQAGALKVIDPGSIAAGKTKDLAAWLWTNGQRDSVVLVLDLERDENARQVRLAARNLQRVRVVGHGALSVHALLGHDRVIFTQRALDALAQACNG